MKWAMLDIQLQRGILNSMITSEVPSSWKELQDLTAKILTECGLVAETEVNLKTVRGMSEVDVLVEENIKGRKYKILIECKYWNKKVPKSVVHSFRSVVGDTGAHVGYIISKSGFQSGSYEAAEGTNIELLDWCSFQNIFEDKWYWEYFVNESFIKTKEIESYLEPLSKIYNWVDYLSDVDRDYVVDLYRHNRAFGVLLFLSYPFFPQVTGRYDKIKLPIAVDEEVLSLLPKQFYDCLSYRDLLSEMLSYSDILLQEFNFYRDKALSRRGGEV